MDFTITPLLELTALMLKNGRSDERNVVGNGLHLLYREVMNTIISPTKISLGEPIKVGHHSEKRHRKAIDDAWNNMGKSVQFDEKAAEHESKAEYWDKRANTINLSMPESIDFYEHKLEVAKEYHAGVKSGKYPRMHSYTLTYAKKDVNEAQKNYDLAVKLWGDV